MPESAARRPVPLDLISTYMIASEIIGFDPGLDWAVRQLEQIPLNHVLAFTSTHAAIVSSLTVDKRSADRTTIEAWFKAEALTRALAKWQSGGTLLAPQILMALAKTAMFRAAPPAAVPGPAANLLPSSTSCSRSTSQTPTRTKTTMSGPVVSHVRSPRTSTSTRRQIPRTSPRASPHAGTTSLRNVPVRKMSTTPGPGSLKPRAPTCLTSCQSRLHYGQGQTTARRTAKEYFAPLGWDDARLQGVLDLLSRTLDDFRDEITREHQQFGDGATPWAFFAFERWPLYRDGDEYVVISPPMLLRRVFGWLPFFDVEHGLKGKARATWGTTFRHLTELYALEVLDALLPVPEGGAEPVRGGRAYDGPTRQTVSGSPTLRSAIQSHGSFWRSTPDSSSRRRRWVSPTSHSRSTSTRCSTKQTRCTPRSGRSARTHQRLPERRRTGQRPSTRSWC